MGSRQRRLVADHSALRKRKLPPNYLFPPDDARSSASDDLSQLTVLLTGPQGTPYSQGLWRLHLKIPDDYPGSPPKVSFRTRIWHPNVEESTGAVCVDTLKRDWDARLTLRDVLITISCLLIHPNPDSALNSAAGALLQEDYDAFAHQARLMTSIHAPIPTELRAAVKEAKLRGDVAGTTVVDLHDECHPIGTPRTGTTVQSLTMKKTTQAENGEAGMVETSASTPPKLDRHNGAGIEVSSDDGPENDDDAVTAFKENQPSLSPLPCHLAPQSPSPRKNPHGKRPLSELVRPVDIDIPMTDRNDGNMDMDGMSSSEKNIAANHMKYHETRTTRTDPTRTRKQPHFAATINCSVNNTSRRVWEDVRIYEDATNATGTFISSADLPLHRMDSEGGKENPNLQNTTTIPMKESSSSSRAEFPHRNSTLGTIPATTTAISPGILFSLPSSSFTTATSSSSTSIHILSSASSLSKIPYPFIGNRKLSSSAVHTGAAKSKPRLGVRRL